VTGEGSASEGQPQTETRLGVFGGTFDPIHVGHLVAAEIVAGALGLGEVRFVPAADPPHKPGSVGTPAEQRLQMVQLAIAGNAAFTTSRIDIDRSGPHYTVELLRRVRSSVGPDARIHFIMGADSLADLLTWRHPDQIIKLARFAVVGRPGAEPDLALLEPAIPGLAESVDYIEMPLIGISSTEIRARVASGATIRYQVPEPVEQFIARHGLYRCDRGEIG
jgi:nicotinate-nucleotide adenylyltransferase